MFVELVGVVHKLLPNDLILLHFLEELCVLDLQNSTCGGDASDHSGVRPLIDHILKAEDVACAHHSDPQIDEIVLLLKAEIAVFSHLLLVVCA